MKANHYYNHTPAKLPPFGRAAQGLLTAPECYLFPGLGPAEEDALHSKANAVIPQLLRRRSKRIQKLLNDFSSALRRQGLVRVKAKLLGLDLFFEAALGRKLKARLEAHRHLDHRITTYGVVIGAARECHLAHRAEDAAVFLHGSRVQGAINLLGFFENERLADRMVTLLK